MAIKSSGVLRALLVVGVLLSGVLTYVQYTRTQYPTHRPVKLITDFSSYLLSFITRPLIRRFFTIPESDWNRDREVQGLQNPVDVYRDDMGIPYIFAHNEHDAQFARAFFEYTERPFQYEFLRRLATGRLAENFGEDFVPVDFYTRIHMDSDYLRYQLANMSQENKALVDVAITAINQAAEQLPATPIEFAVLGWTHTDWTPLDYMHVRQALALQLSRGYTIDYTRAALQHYLKDYWTRFDLKTAKGVPPISTEGEHPSLFNQRGERMQLPPLPALDDKWAKWRPQDVERLLERLRSAPAKGQQVHQQHEGAAGAGASTNSASFGTASWSGSNAWAVSGRFTASGKPILASDTHLQAMAPGFWMPLFSSVGPSRLLTSSISGEQRRQQRYRVTGASPVGAASVAVGHNGQAAWGQTVSHTDTADLYLVQLNREGTHYLYDGRWCPLRTRVEEIPVKGMSEKVKKVARYTHHGPLYSDAVPIFEKLLKPGEAVAVASVAGRAPISLDYQIALTHAVTWQQFLEAAAIDEQLGLVTVWATAQGDMGATPSGAIPVRPPPREKHRFRDGSSSASDWNGVLPPTMIPTVVNPPSGFVGVGNSRLSEDPNDIYGSVFTPGMRQRRVQELLRELTLKGNLQSADMIEMQNDVHSIPGREFRDYVLRTVLFAYKPRTDAPAQLEDASRHSVTVRTICAEEGLTEEDGRWLYATMGQWNANMDVDSVGATVCELWQQWTLQALLKKHGFSNEVLSILIGAPLNDVWLPAFEILNHWTYNLLRALDERADVVTDVSNSERLVCNGAVATLKWLRARYGDSSDAWKWGNVRARFIDHPIGAAVPLLRHTASVGPLRWGGNFATIKSHHVIAGELSLENPWNAAYTKSLDTPVLRMVVDLGNLKNSFWSVLPGVSGWVANKHYDNFASSIEAATGTAHMRPMLWTDDQIEQAAVTHMKLLPKKPSPVAGDKKAGPDHISDEL